MIGEYFLKSYWYRQNPISNLTDPRKQKARIEIKSQRYLAYTFWIGGYSDRIRRQWNELLGKAIPYLPETAKAWRAIVIEDALKGFIQEFDNPNGM